jgi:hypothetical protein
MNWALNTLTDVMPKLDSANVVRDLLDEPVTAARYEQFISYSSLCFMY